MEEYKGESIKGLLKEHKEKAATPEYTEEDLLNHCIKNIGFALKKRIIEQTGEEKDSLNLNDLWKILDEIE